MQIHIQNPLAGSAKFSLRLAGICGPLALAICLAFCPAPIRAQEQHSPQIGFPTAPGTIAEPASSDPAVRRMMRKMAKERNTDRQKKIEADTARLLELARQLHAAVADSSKNTLSIEVVKDADEIEKLAKTIKEKMRNGE
jgi:hypothetical protein